MSQLMPPASGLRWQNNLELEALLRSLDPRVRLISERRMLSILDQLEHRGECHPYNAQLALLVDRETLCQLLNVEARIVGGQETVMLLMVEPDDRGLSNASPAAVMHTYSRLLFATALSELLRSAEISQAYLFLPDAVKREIRFVLEADDRLPEGPTEHEIWVAFAAMYIETVSFTPQAIRDVFPLLQSASLDEDALLPASTWRPILERFRSLITNLPESHPSPGILRESEPQTATMEEVQHAKLLGNHVRAAIIRTRKGILLGGREQERNLSAASEILRQGVVTPLSAIFGWSEQKSQAWLTELTRLLPHASVGFWPQAARALYDLQRISNEFEKPLFALAATEWVSTFGNQPLKVPLNHARNLILLQQLLKAEKHVVKIPSPEAERAGLLQLLEQEIHSAEDRVRTQYSPLIRTILEEVDLLPTTSVEQVAKEKLIAELLDTICERGFIRISDLRDALARNQLKLKDLKGAKELYEGDAILKANQLLGKELYGIYNRGEIYMRMIQRFSSVNFGTKLGRFVTLYATLPLLISVLILGFTKEMIHMYYGMTDLAARLLTPSQEPLSEIYYLDPDLAPKKSPLTNMQDPVDSETAPKQTPSIGTSNAAETHASFDLFSWPVVLSLTIVVFALMHSPQFRRFLLSIFRIIGQWLRSGLIDWPHRFWNSTWIRKIRSNWLLAFFRRYVFLPLSISMLIMLILTIRFRLDLATVMQFGGTILVLLILAMNSPFGRKLLDELAELWSDSWRYFRWNLLPGLYTLFVWAFRALAGWIERTIYSIDEWFRFREGQPRELLWLKTSLALIWFPIVYLFRFTFYLLVEPQVNPIKHFPVVTVSHKLLLPLIPTLSQALKISVETSTVLIGCVPGIFGFLVWELKENWRLYSANRSRTLRPAILGHHGETMRGLLRPGFHSGTVPKIYRKLRTAHRKQPSVPITTLSHLHHELHDLQRAIGNMIQREILALWNRVRSVEALKITLDKMTIGCQRIEIQFRSVRSPEAILVAIENQQGTIVGEIHSPDWLSTLDAETRESLDRGLLGLLAYFSVEKFANQDEFQIAWNDWLVYWSRTIPLAKPALA